MEKGTDALAAAGEAVEPRELDPIELSDDDVAVIRATQGPMPVVAGALRAGRRAPRRRSGRGAASGSSRCASATALRRVAAILFHRRAGFSANGMGVWEVPDDEILDTGRRMAAFRGISHCYQRPDLRRLAVLRVHDGPRPLEGGVRRGPRRDRRDDRDHRARDALLEHRVQEDPDALLHRRVPRVGARARVADHLAHRYAVGGALPPRAAASCPAASTRRCARCARSAATRCSSSAAAGAELTDVDGNTYVDYVCSWGPLIHGHAYPPVARGGRRRRPSAARPSARRPPPRSSSPRLSPSAMPSVEMLRMTSSGTEASMSAIRLARAATGREKLVKFAGAYHGHVDGLLAEAGSGPRHAGHPGLARRARGRRPPRP